MGRQIVQTFHKRVSDAQEGFTRHLQQNLAENIDKEALPATPLRWRQSLDQYMVDSFQHGVLFVDAPCQRDDTFLQQLEEGQPPILHFDYEILLDGRQFDKPVNYARARILPSGGVKVIDRKMTCIEM